MTTMVINLQANRSAWDADRPMIVAKCRICHTCYPERDLERADMQEGVCAGCRAVNRASMDLTRALADLRQGR